MLSRVKFDISKIVNEMLNCLPETVWDSSTTTFIDPAMGGGQFVAAIESRLREHGHSDDNIKDRVFGFETNTMRLQYAKNKNKLVGQYQKGDFLSWETNMKFDVVIGNPPYQLGENSSFYKQFIDKALILSDTVAFVVPSSYFRNKKNFNNISAYRYLDEFFKPEVQITVAYFIYIKMAAQITIFDDKGNSVTRDNSQIRYIPTNDVSLFPIVDNILDMELKGWELKSGNISRTNVKANKSNSGIPCIITAGFKDKDYDWEYLPKSFAGVLGGLGVDKVVCSVDYTNGKIGVLKYADPTHGCSARCGYVTVANKTEADYLIHYLNSKIVKAMAKILKGTSGKNSQGVFSKIPAITLDRFWTDEELYKHFALTDAEIKLVEDTIK